MPPGKNLKVTTVVDQSTGTPIELPSSQPSLKKSPTNRLRQSDQSKHSSPLKLSLNVLTKQLSPPSVLSPII